MAVLPHAQTNGFSHDHHPNGNGNGHSASSSSPPTPVPSNSSKHRLATRLIHDGSEASEETGAVIPGISLSTTYKQQAVAKHKVCHVHVFATQKPSVA